MTPGLLAVCLRCDDYTRDRDVCSECGYRRVRFAPSPRDVARDLDEAEGTPTVQEGAS